MAALVQTLPQQTTTVTMLQTRPSSASGTLQPSQNQAAYHQYPVNPQQRNNFHGLNNNNMATSNYRGHNSMAPIAPYAFTSTPVLSIGQQAPNGSQSRPDQQRTSSAPIVPTLQGGSGNPANRSRYPATLSVSTTSSSASSELSQRPGTKDDSAITSTARVATRAPRPHSTIITSYGQSQTPPMASPSKPAPDRYRRPANRRAESSSSSQASGPSPSASTMPNVMQFYGASTQAVNTQSFNLQMPQVQSQPSATADDMQLNQRTTSEQAKRYRRRSIHTIDAHENSNAPNPVFVQQGSRQVSSASSRIDQQPEQHGQHPLRSSPVVTIRPSTSHGRNDSTDSLKSTRSGHSRPNSSDKREATSVSMSTASPAQSSTSPVANSSTSNGKDQAISKNDQPRLVNIPVRASSTDAAKRLSSPSPLSKPVTMGTESSASKSKDSFASAVNAALQPTQSKSTYAQGATSPNTTSPAARHLAALNEKEGKKSKTSRLRRAFSFGSAAELRKASAENHHASRSGNDVLDRSKLRREKYQHEQEAEQDKIAQQQEAAGIGSNIYSGQGNFFTGSTDNLSISSTASSASVMIRKMGKGMKKSTRSLVGLFRPKSVIGVPAADAAVPEASQAQVSMVNVEAEREKVNVTANAADAASGGTGFPRLERNSLEAGAISSVVTDRLGSANTENSANRKSIVGGEKERAEVLAAVKKGILKRSGTGSGNSSPVILPVDGKAANFNSPQIPNVNNESPNSSAPSTPNDDQVHKQSVTLGGEDYFMSALKFRGDSKSVPGTPSGATKRNATFSPRIQFHDTWPSQEYDRRGEIATCNRLTPMLAQQIKEELNTFKMEMEVHENSKIYTHFF
ncbi:bud neck involved protein [Ciborinia camelliae]|nr:bud neck involved protein [Ciborinia camelliae]